ncbi:hypothetical protein SAMN05421755_108213 [Nitrosomonas sp. Nm33]|nr:hypothetical protein SAMN05421755_108213 [Nitrosomonas sp. Nm33]
MTKLAAVVGQDRMDLVRNDLDQVAQKGRRYFPVRFVVQLGIGELTGAVDGDEQIELAFLGAHFSDVDMKVSNGILLELLFRGFIAIYIRQPTDAVTLIAAMQG